MMTPIISQDMILQILANSNRGLKLKEIKRVLEVTSYACKFKNEPSINTSVIQKLDRLRLKGYVSTAKQYRKDYSVTPQGLKYLAELELKNLINEDIMGKMI